MTARKEARRRGGRLAVFLVVLAFSAVALILFADMEPEREIGQRESEVSAPTASVIAVAPAAHRATIRTLGEVTPLYQLDLTAMVDGRVEYVHPGLRNGAVLPAGSIVARIDRSRYIASLASAQSARAQAELALRIAQREADDARRGWERTGRSLDEAGELALRRPQLRVAVADLTAAEAQVSLAKRTLEDTTITMPFDGVVMSLGPAPQTNLVAGTTIARIASAEEAEIAVTIDDAQRRLLPNDVEGTAVRIADATNGADSWPGTITRVARHVDDLSRKRVIWISVERPLEANPPLLPGTFVTVEIAGKVIANTLRIPETALTSAGLVWFVTARDRLQSVAATALFYDRGHAVIRAPADDELLISPEAVFTIATAPNNSFVNGMAVSSVFEGAP